MPRREGVDVGQTRNITFRNIRANSENGILIAGREGVPIENLLFDNVHVIYDQWTMPVRPHREYTAGNHPGGGRQYDRARGVWLEHVKGVTWKDSSLTFNPVESEFFGDCQGGYGVEDQDVRGLDCLHPEKPASTDYAKERATRGNW